MKKLIAITLTSAALIASMSAPARAEHGETLIGAVIGTTIGTVIGHEVGGRRGTVIGAVIGAATGATIGRDIGYRHHERVEYYPEPVYRHHERVEYYPEPVYRHPRPVERVIYVPSRRGDDDCDEREHGRWKRHHGHDRGHGRNRHERRHWN